jgi:GT2 family glycosyltransferase
MIGDRFLRNLSQHYNNLDYPNYEIFIVTDKPVTFNLHNYKFLSTGQNYTGPGEKKDIAIYKSDGDIVAFTDDDAYPHRSWLKNAIKYFDNQKVGAVCGPGMTPPEDNFWQRAGGAVYESFLGSGGYQYRFLPKKVKKVDDYPSYNLLVRRELLLKIGGFNSKFYGGEDTKLCLKIIKSHIIIYAPDVIIFHHRRSLFREHAKQVLNIGIHRGYFVKVYPETSRRFTYFIPSLALLLTFLSIILFFLFVKFAMLFFCALTAITIVCFVSIFCKQKSTKLSIVAALGLICHHLIYGYGFLKGLLVKKLER